MCLNCEDPYLYSIEKIYPFDKNNKLDKWIAILYNIFDKKSRGIFKVMNFFKGIIAFIYNIFWGDWINIPIGGGRTLDISPFEVAAYEAVGWYTEEETKNTVTMYAKDDAGNFTRTIVVPEREVEAYRGVAGIPRKKQKIL